MRLNGGIESNPDPCTYDIQKTVQGSFHQGRPKFGETSGIQCACKDTQRFLEENLRRG